MFAIRCAAQESSTVSCVVLFFYQHRRLSGSVEVWYQERHRTNKWETKQVCTNVRLCNEMPSLRFCGF